MATHGRFEEARQALETAISLGAHSPEVYFYLEQAKKIQKSDDAPPYPSELFLMKPSRDW
jgi:hypothetical protein